MNKFFIACICMSVVAANSLIAQPPNEKLHLYLDSIYRHHAIPGFSVVVVKKGKIFFSQGFGVQEYGMDKPFTASSTIAVGSLTKSFTALAIIKLVEEGKIELDAPVTNYLPWFRTANKIMSDKITIRMLLNNTSGLTSPAMLSFEHSAKAMEQFVRNLSNTFLSRLPGSTYEYSNAGFVTAGVVISSVSGMSYSDFLDQKIFRPFKMLQTTTDPGHIKQLHAVTGHYYGIRSPHVANREAQFESISYTPAGSLLHSSANNLGKYLIALCRDQSRNSFWTSYVSFPGLSKDDGGDGHDYHYGLGWMISTIEGRTIIHHGGSTGKTSSFMMIDTAARVAAAILMNTDVTFIDKYRYAPAFNILNNVLRIVSGRTTTRFGIPVTGDPTANTFHLPVIQLNKYTGHYIQKRGGDMLVYFGTEMKIEKKDTSLVATIFRGSQIISDFMLDFISPASAVTRNMALPQHIKCKMDKNGNVNAIFVNNIEYVRMLPNMPDFNDLGLISGKSAPGQTSFSEIIRSQLGPETVVLRESMAFSRVIGPYLWREKVFLLLRGKEEKQYVMAYTILPHGGHWFLLTAQPEKITSSLQHILLPALENFGLPD